MQTGRSVSAYIGIGANLGDARAAVLRAMDDLAGMPGIAVQARSSLYLTAPIDATGPDYVNAVAEVSTTLTAPELLTQLQALEQQAGRERPYLNAPRTLDLDILLYGEAQMQSPGLTVPHPRFKERAFVLQPLAEVAPKRVAADWLSAVAGQRVRRLT